MTIQLRQLLTDLRKKQEQWRNLAKDSIFHQSFDVWWNRQSQADAYQDAADQLEAILCAAPSVSADKFYR